MMLRIQWFNLDLAVFLPVLMSHLSKLLRELGWIICNIVYAVFAASEKIVTL